METITFELSRFLSDTFDITNNRDEKIRVSVKYDLNGATVNDVMNWVAANRRIQLQRVLRPLTATEIEAINGTVILAANAGKKIRSRSDKVNDLVAAGVPRPLAERIVDEPELINKLLASDESSEMGE